MTDPIEVTEKINPYMHLSPRLDYKRPSIWPVIGKLMIAIVLMVTVCELIMEVL